MNFPNLPLEIHHSLVEYLHVPDLVSLSQTSVKLRRLYFGPAWATCFIVSPDNFYFDLDRRSITSRAFESGSEDSVIQEAKQNIRAIAFIKHGFSSPVVIPPEYFVFHHLNTSELSSLRQIIIDYEASPLVSYIFTEETSRQISDSELINFEMFKFKRKVSLRDTENMSLCYETDPDLYKNNKFFQGNGHITLSIDKPFLSYEKFVIDARDPQKLYNELSVLNLSNIYKLSIDVIDPELLQRLLDVSLSFPNLSKASLSVQLLLRKPTKYMWPADHLINHDCFSRVKVFVLHLIEGLKFSYGTPHYTPFPTKKTELKYVTKLNIHNDALCQWSPFWNLFLLPRVESLKIGMAVDVPLNTLMPQLTSLKCGLSYTKDALHLASSCTRELVNIKTLSLDLKRFICYKQDLLYDTFKREYFKLVNSLAQKKIGRYFRREGIQDISLLRALSVFRQELKEISLRISQDIKSFKYEMVDDNAFVDNESIYKVRSSSSSSLDCNSDSDCSSSQSYPDSFLRSDSEYSEPDDDPEFKLRPMLVNLFLLKFLSLSRLTRLELQMEKYVHFEYLPILIDEHSTLDEVVVEVEDYFLEKLWSSLEGWSLYGSSEEGNESDQSQQGSHPVARSFASSPYHSSNDDVSISGSGNDNNSNNIDIDISSNNEANTNDTDNSIINSENNSNTPSDANSTNIGNNDISRDIIYFTLDQMNTMMEGFTRSTTYLEFQRTLRSLKDIPHYKQEIPTRYIELCEGPEYTSFKVMIHACVGLHRMNKSWKLADK